MQPAAALPLELPPWLDPADLSPRLLRAAQAGAAARAAAVALLTDPGYLRERRKLARLSQTELARLCGLSQSLISLFECGARRPTAERAIHILSVLQTEVGRWAVQDTDAPGEAECSQP